MTRRNQVRSRGRAGFGVLNILYVMLEMVVRLRYCINVLTGKEFDRFVYYNSLIIINCTRTRGRAVINTLAGDHSLPLITVTR